MDSSISDEQQFGGTPEGGNRQSHTRIYLGDVPLVDPGDNPEHTLSVFQRAEGDEDDQTRAKPSDASRLSIAPVRSAEERFQLHQMVGVGGCGEVWSATQRSLGRIVAVKVVRPEDPGPAKSTSETESFTSELFYAEAVTTALLEHPNIVPVYDFGVGSSGSPMIAMKLVKGSSWAQVLTRDYNTMPVDDYLAKHLPIYISMMQAVAFAHSKGIVHRDLKPNQVMIGEFGEVLLMDWGLAIRAGHPSTEGSLDLAAINMVPWTPLTASSPGGTPCYMAPEQTRKSAELVTYTTDIYLLGGTLYYLLTNEPPRRGKKSADTMVMAAKGFVAPFEESAKERFVPPELKRLALRALSPERDKRPAAVLEMIEEVRAYMSGATSRAAAGAILEEAQGEIETICQAGAATASEEEAAVLYSRCSEVLAQLNRAAVLWPRHPLLSLLTAKVLLVYSSKALEQNDLMLARGLAGLMEDEPARNEVLAEVDAQTRKQLRYQKQRRLLLWMVAGFVVALAALSFSYLQAQRSNHHRITHERDIANIARQSAELARERANLLQADAEVQQYFATISAVDNAFGRGRRDLATSLLLGAPQRLRNWEWGHLAERLFGGMFTLAPQEFLASASLSPDGKWLYSGSRDGAIHVWDTTNGRYNRIMPVFNGRLYEVAASPDGKRLLASSYGPQAAIVDANTGRRIHRLAATGTFLSCTWSHDGSRVAVASMDGSVYFWDASTGKQTGRIANFDAAPRVVKFSAGDDTLLVGTAGPAAGIYNWQTGQQLIAFAGIGDGVIDAAFSPDGVHAAVASQDGFVRTFDVKTGALIRSESYAGTYPSAVTFIDKGKMLAVALENGKLLVEDAVSGNVVADAIGVLTPHQMVESPDGSRLYLAGRFHIHCYDMKRLIQRPHVLRDVPAGLSEDSFDARISVFGLTPGREPTWNQRERNWNTEAGRTILQNDQFRIAVDSRYSAFSPDGRYRFNMSATNLAEAVVTDLRTSVTVFHIRSPKMVAGFFSPDSRWLAVLDALDKVELVDTSSWQVVDSLSVEKRTTGPLSIHSYVGAWASFAPDSSSLAVAYLSGHLVNWDVASRTIRWSTPRTIGIGSSVEFSHDGKQIAVGGNDDRITLWDAENGNLVQEFIGHDRPILGTDFTGDGTRLLSFARDATVRLWDVSSGREILTLLSRPLSNMVLGARFTKAESAVAIIQQDGSLVCLPKLPTTVDAFNDAGLTTATELVRMNLFGLRQVLGPHVTAEDLLAKPVRLGGM